MGLFVLVILFCELCVFLCSPLLLSQCTFSGKVVDAGNGFAWQVVTLIRQRH